MVGATLLLAQLVSLACGVGSPKAAELSGYPTKPIRVIVGIAPGGSAELTARAIGQKLTESLGQTIVVDNRSGASAIIGT